MANARNSSVNAYLAWVQQQRAAGAALVAGSVSNASDSLTLTDDRFRRGAHIFMIDRVTLDARGVPNGIVLRNPYGGEQTLRDYTHIWFLLGGGGRWNLP